MPPSCCERMWSTAMCHRVHFGHIPGLVSNGARNVFGSTLRTGQRETDSRDAHREGRRRRQPDAGLLQLPGRHCVAAHLQQMVHSSIINCERMLVTSVLRTVQHQGCRRIRH